jgi:hypothetical protein
VVAQPGGASRPCIFYMLVGWADSNPRIGLA